MRFGKPRKNQRRINPRYFLNETAKIENNSSKNMHDVQFYLEEFYPFAKEALGFDQDATIVFESDFSNAKNPLGKTAQYDPINSTVTVYVDKRHPKDVMRSVSHELVHHAQNVRGDLQGGSMEEGYAQTNDHLREMEKEAYTKGNMLFRDWTDSRSNPNDQQGVMARLMQEWGYDETALNEEGAGFEEGQLVTVVASALAVDGEKKGTVVSFEDPAVLIKLDDDQEGKYVPDDKMVKVKKDYVEARAESGFADTMGEGVEGEVNPIDFANEHDLDYQTDNEGNVVLYLTQEQGEDLWLPDNADNWQVEKTSYGDDGEGGYVIYTNTPYVQKEEANVNEDFDDDDFDMAELEQEFPWLAKDVKTGKVPPEVAAELADEFGDKEEPEEGEPVDELGDPAMRGTWEDEDDPWGDAGEEEEEEEKKESLREYDVSKTLWMEKFAELVPNPDKDLAHYLHRQGLSPEEAAESHAKDVPEKVDEFLGAKIQKNVKKINKKGTDNVKAAAGHVARMKKEKEKEEESVVMKEAPEAPDWVDQLVQMAADDNPDAYATNEVTLEYNNYEHALEEALVKLVGEEVAEEMMNDEAPYAVLMTLMGHGVGIWDGRWDHFEEQGIDIDELEAGLRQALGGFADDTGSGTLNDAIQNAAYETAGGEESNPRTGKGMREYGDHETQAAGGLVSTSYSSDPEMDQIQDLALDVVEGGGQLMQVATALQDQGFDASLQAGVLLVDGKYFVGKPEKFEIGPEEETREAGPYVVGYVKSGMAEKVIKEAEFVGHHAEIGGETYVDSNFLNSVKKIRDTFPSELKSMGFGEFYLETPKGRVDFNRSRGEDFPGVVGRSHQLSSDPPELAGELIAAMEAAGASEKATVEEKMSPEEEKAMTDKMSNKEFHDYATKGKFTRPSIDRERYTDLSAEGLEGPFQFNSGAILYYDSKAGKYYDRDKDMYLDREEAAELTMETLKESEHPLVYKKTVYGWSYEDDETIGMMLKALVDGGVLEWHEVTDQESLKKMLASHKEGLQGGMERWDPDVFEDYYNVDVEFVIQEWAKMNGREAVNSEENEEGEEDEAENQNPFVNLEAITLDEDATNEAFLKLEMFDTGSAGDEVGGMTNDQKKAQCEGKGGTWTDGQCVQAEGHWDSGDDDVLAPGEEPADPEEVVDPLAWANAFGMETDTDDAGQIIIYTTPKLDQYSGALERMPDTWTFESDPNVPDPGYGLIYTGVTAQQEPAVNEDDFDLFGDEPEEVSPEETVTLVHKASGKEIVVTARAAQKKLATGEWEEMSDTRGPAQPPLKEKQQETQDMNLEEMVRAAVKKALDEKKYRREDEKEEEVEEGKYRREDEDDEKNEALKEDEDKGDEDEPQGELSAAQKELDLDDDGKIEPSDLKGLRGGKKDADVGKEKEEEEKEEKNEAPDKEWYDSELFENLKRKWAK